MLGHHYVSVDAEVVLDARAFEREYKSVARFGVLQLWEAVIAGEGNEMRLPRLVVALKVGGHFFRVVG